MKPTFKTKLTALFVLAFLYLNVGGAVCLAYCQGAMKVQAAATAHCPMHPTKSGGHDQNGETAAGIGSVTCCTIAINIFAAPLEKKQKAPAAELFAVAKPNRIVFTVPAVFSSEIPNRPAFVPPKLDSRDARVKNCVFRI